MSVCMGLHTCVIIDLCVCVWCARSVWSDVCTCSVWVCAPLQYVCMLLYLCICVCMWVCVRASTYWQGFKEMFLLRLSLICPAEYKELLKGYYTAEPWPSWRLSQHLKSPRAVTAITVWSIFRCSCKKIIGLQGEIGLTPDSWQWKQALIEYSSFIFTFYTLIFNTRTIWLPRLTYL